MHVLFVGLSKKRLQRLFILLVVERWWKLDNQGPKLLSQLRHSLVKPFPLCLTVTQFQFVRYLLRKLRGEKKPFGSDTFPIGHHEGRRCSIVAGINLYRVEDL